MNIPTKHCPQCGTSATSTALFCAQCGSQFAPPAPELSAYVCEECDTVLPGGSRFCPGCGMAFDTPVPAEEPDSALNFQQPSLHHRRSISGSNFAVAMPASSSSAPSEGYQSATTGLSSLNNLKATKGSVLILGTLLAIVFFAAGFGLIQLAHPHTATTNVDNAASAPAPEQAVAATASPVSSDDSSASNPQGVQGDNSDNDVSVSPSPQTAAPNPASEVRDKSDHKAANADNTITAYAPPGSGLSDVPLSTNTLQNQVITSNDLKKLSLRALSISRNSIYALHGYVFLNPSIRAYFETQNWYHPDPTFSEAVFSSTEHQNVQAIQAAERTKVEYNRASFGEKLYRNGLNLPRHPITREQEGE